MFKKLLLACSLVFFTQNLVANEQVALKSHFLTLIDKVTKIVEDKSLDKHARNSNIISTLAPSFDFELMAKLSLGSSWKKLNSDDKKRFVELYVKRMENSYSSKVDAYSGEKVEVKDIKQPKKNRIALITDLVSKDENLEMVYKFYKPKKKQDDKEEWLIYDVEILGVSILKTDKAQFKEYLKTHSITALIAQLDKNI